MLFRSKLLKGLAVSLLLGTAITTSALTVAADSAQLLAKKLGAYQSLEADFVQYLLDASGSRLQETRGTMQLLQPNRFYWQTEDPFAQTIVSDGEQVWIYDPDLEQVTLQLLDTRSTATPALLLSGDNQAIGEQFNVLLFEGANGLEQFDLKPKDAESLYANIRLYFQNDELTQMQVVDTLEQKTAMHFQNLQANPSIPKQRFIFDVPADTDVIDMR
jgi:outer membrane lipoprotein carrier protein